MLKSCRVCGKSTNTKHSNPRRQCCCVAGRRRRPAPLGAPAHLSTIFAWGQSVRIRLSSIAQCNHSTNITNSDHYDYFQGLEAVDGGICVRCKDVKVPPAQIWKETVSYPYQP